MVQKGVSAHGNHTKWETKTVKVEEGEDVYGKFEHTIDAKGRLFLPSKLREPLGEDFYVIPGLDTCLYVYNKEGWGKIQQKIDEVPLSQRTRLRCMLGSIAPSSLDKQGRFQLTAELKKFAQLDQEVTILGQGDHLEIWDREIYRAQEAEQLTPEYIRSVMEGLGF